MGPVLGHVCGGTYYIGSIFGAPDWKLTLMNTYPEVQMARSRSYLDAFGPSVGIIPILGAWACGACPRFVLYMLYQWRLKFPRLLLKDPYMRVVYRWLVCYTAPIIPPHEV